MTVTRRHVLKSLAGASATTLPLISLSHVALAQGVEITTLSDGYLTLPGSLLFEPMPQAELASLIDAFGLDAAQLTPDCNLALLRDGTRNVLFDVGAGPDFMPTAGRLADSLEAAGLAPQDITDVVFTHAHPDHIWGLLDAFDEPVFADARYHMGRTEWDYWWNPETVETIGEARAAFAVGARRRMEVIEDRVALFDAGDEVLAGIAAIASHGHTPGHMSFEIRAGSESVLVVGDAIGNHHVAFAKPDWPSGADQDKTAAIAARQMLLDRLASEQMRLVGFHLPGGGIGQVVRDGGAYRFVVG